MKKYSERKIYLFLFAVIILFVALGIVREQKKLYAPIYPKEQVPQTVEISRDELRAFLTTMVKYKKENPKAVRSSDLSLGTASSPAEENEVLSAWVVEHGWDAKRFFYIDTRVRIIISTILKDKAILARKTLMDETASAMSDKNLVESVREEYLAQQKNLNIEKISDNERQMVEPQLKEIAQIIGQEIY